MFSPKEGTSSQRVTFKASAEDSPEVWRATDRFFVFWMFWFLFFWMTRWLLEQLFQWNVHLAISFGEDEPTHFGEHLFQLGGQKPPPSD